MSTGLFPTGGKHPKAAALRNRRAIRGWRPANNNCLFAHMGHLAAVQVKPVPDVETYEEWLAAHRSADPRGKSAWAGKKLRRGVLMRRNGCSMKEIAAALGCSGNNVCVMLKKLPPELAP